jgi:hypothetical protein
VPHFVRVDSRRNRMSRRRLAAGVLVVLASAAGAAGVALAQDESDSEDQTTLEVPPELEKADEEDPGMEVGTDPDYPGLIIIDHVGGGSLPESVDTPDEVDEFIYGHPGDSPDDTTDDPPDENGE